MYLEHEFEYAIKHDNHPIGCIDGRAVFHVWGIIDFDWKISELWLRDADSRELFKLELDSILGQENRELAVRLGVRQCSFSNVTLQTFALAFCKARSFPLR